MHYQDSSHNSIDGELLSYFEKHPYSLLDRNHINVKFGKEMHNHLVRLEKDKFILRSKIKVRDKPTTYWQLNGKFDTERHRSSNNYQVSKQIYETDNLFIEVYKGNEFNNLSSVSFIKPRLNDNNWVRGKYSSRQKISDLPEKVDKIELDSQTDELTFKHFQQFQLNQHPPVIKREEKVMNKIEPNSSRSDRTFTKISQPNLNSPKFKRKENIMGNTVSDSVKYERKFTKIPQSKLNPNSPEFKRQSFRENKDENIETEHSDSSSQMLNNFYLEFMTALTKNPVCVLHEFCQQRGVICEFKIVEMQGPSHKPRISTAVFLNGKMYDTVVTSNKKEGKRKAADLAIRNLISKGYFETKPSRSIKSDNGVHYLDQNSIQHVSISDKPTNEGNS